MAARIHRLSEYVINQIAAGEVIERPASVVKELLENSLDAGAASIEIDIEEGGSQLVRVTDDGVGIIKEDLPLACCRHATSKITTISDLEQVNTLGFRGEALSSIASVARVRLCSYARDADLGWEIVASGRDSLPLAPRPAALRPGTIVEVRDLFFTTPARRKFLRSPRSEFLHILGLVRRVAMSRPAVSFRLTHNNRQALRYVATESESRAQQIFGASFTRSARALVDEDEGIKVWGWLFVPTVGAARANEQYWFLNGRMLRDRRLVHALHQAADGCIVEPETLGCIIFVELDPATFDVNVHPTKLEVRFRDVRMLHDRIYSIVRRTLERDRLTAVPETIAETRVVYPESDLTPERRLDVSRLSAGAAVRAGSVTVGTKAVTPLSRLGKPVTVLYERFLLTNASSASWYLVDIEALLNQIVDAEVNGTKPPGSLLSVPLLLPLQLSQVWATPLERAREPLQAFGFSLEIRHNVLTCVKVPALLRGIEYVNFWHGLADCLAQAQPDALLSPPWFREGFVRAALRSTTATTNSEWLHACLLELELLLQSTSVAEESIYRRVEADDLRHWFAGSAR